MGSSCPAFTFELWGFFFAGDFFIAFAIMNAAKMLIIFGCNECLLKKGPFSNRYCDPTAGGTAPLFEEGFLENNYFFLLIFSKI